MSPPATERPAGVVAFSDIVGFTEFTAVEGDEAALELLGAHERAVGAVLPDCARVVKELGDGLLLWFDDPAQAVVAGLALQAASEQECDRTGLPLGLRVGMHWGAPMVRGGDLIGHTVNVVARIVTVAGPGEVLVSDAAQERACTGLDDVTFDELGPVVMKGLPEPIRLFRAALVTSRASAAVAPAAP